MAKWKLSSSAHDALSQEIDEMRSEWDEMSERWQEGDRGQAVACWLDELSDGLDSLESLPDEPTY